MSAIGRRDHARASRFGRFDQTIARVLVLSLLAMTPLPVSAGEELVDANNTTFDDATVTLDNSQPGLTTFDIGTNSSTIGWEDLQQPEDNTLTFNLPDSDSIVLNYIGAQHPSNLNGNVMSNGTVAFSNPFGVFIGDTAVVNVGDLIAIGANVTHEDFMSSESMLLSLTGTVENNGLILADRNVALIGSNVTNNGEIIAETGHVLAIAGQYMTLEDWDALTSDFLAPKNFFGLLTDGRVENHGSIAAQSAAIFGGRVVNHGEIEIADHSLLMVGADAVWVTEFDNPVLIKIPNTDQSEGLNDDQAASDASQDAQYAIENHGHIDAGLGHVRLAAADPWASRFGRGWVVTPRRRLQFQPGESTSRVARRAVSISPERSTPAIFRTRAAEARSTSPDRSSSWRTRRFRLRAPSAEGRFTLEASRRAGAIYSARAPSSSTRTVRFEPTRRSAAMAERSSSSRRTSPRSTASFRHAEVGKKATAAS
jgi:filamentous hemagglutinin family protein